MLVGGDPLESTKTPLTWRLATPRRPQIHRVQVRHRGSYSYIDAELSHDTTIKLCRLRYTGSAHTWGFAIWRSSHKDSRLPTGLPAGTCEDTLDVACGRYLTDPTAWTQPPTN